MENMAQSSVWQPKEPGFEAYPSRAVYFTDTTHKFCLNYIFRVTKEPIRRVIPRTDINLNSQ